jgi:uncharacterized membrane protein (DUF485 family)
MSSFMGIIFGFLMFLGSFVLLYFNEGRVDLSQIAKTAIDISATDAPPADADKKLVCAKGKLASSEKLGDDYLKAGDFLAIERKAEMYAWVEKKSSKTNKNLGGSETTHNDYTYVREWTESPKNSSDFKVSSGHENPTMRVKSSSKTATKATLGDYSININEVSLPSLRSHNFRASEVNFMDKIEFVSEGQLYLSYTGSSNDPQVGDIRITYSVLPNPIENAIIFGNLDAQAKSITPHIGKKESKLYRIFDTDRASAIAEMSSEHKAIAWLLRVIGFLLMWIGLSMLFGPISTFLDVLPIFGTISRTLIGGLCFIVALVLSSVTIIVSMILHNPIALIVSLLAVIGGIVWYMKSRRAATR